MLMNKKIDTVILDVDGTLSEDISWLKLTEGLGVSSEKHSEIFNQFRKGLLTYPEAKKQLIELWQSSGNANKDYMENMFKSWKLKEGAEDIVCYLEKSYRVCIISGAVDLYVKVVAKKLGVSVWYANTELVWDNRGNLVDFHYFADQAAKKLEQFRLYIKKNRLDRTRCAIVGDGDSDIALFRELKYGIAVNAKPHPELESLAYKRLKNIQELKDIF